MRVIKVDQDALTLAFDDNSVERSYYLDMDTGRVFNLLEDHNDPETEEVAWQIEADGGRRYIQVPKLSIEEELREREAFVESIEDAELKSRLARVLETDGAGRRFQETVSKERLARDKWRAFRRASSRERMDRWLKSLGLSAN